MSKNRLSTRSAAQIAADIERALVQDGLGRRFLELLAPLRAHDTLATSYLQPAGRAQVKALLDATARSWRGPLAATLRGELRANLASGGHPFGLLNLLGSPLPTATDAGRGQLTTGGIGRPALRLLPGGPDLDQP